MKPSERLDPSTRRAIFVPHDLAAPLHGASDGPLTGLTAAVKDMYDIVGERTGGGNPDWLAAQRPAAKHAAAVARLLDAGASIVGKAVCDEFFYSVSGANAHYGTPPNLRAPGRLPGGSSSGSAAAVAAGACDFALGSDTGGSVRVPAALCGLYGIRPTHGRVDLTGAMEMAPSFDVAGWFAAGPGVFRRIGAVLLDQAAVAVPVERMLVGTDLFAQADADVAAVVEDVLQRARRSLPAARATTVAPDGFDAWREAFRVIQGREVWAVYGDFIRQARLPLGPGIKERMDYAASVTAADAQAARAVHAQARAHINGLIAPGTILALPTAPSIAPRTDASAGELDNFRARVMRLTCIAGLGGLPQVSIPAGTVRGCPVGLSLVGWHGGDEALLDLAGRVAPYIGVEG